MYNAWRKGGRGHMEEGVHLGTMYPYLNEFWMRDWVKEIWRLDGMNNWLNGSSSEWSLEIIDSKEIFRDNFRDEDGGIPLAKLWRKIDMDECCYAWMKVTY